MAGFNLDDYVDVAERILLFEGKFPTGSLQSEVIAWPTPECPFVAVKAYAYRNADDPRPGIGLAWEDYPGKTPYTKGSELMNAETSAWGRAIVAVLAASTKRIASKQEVKRSQESGGGNAPEAVTGKGGSEEQPSPDVTVGETEKAGVGPIADAPVSPAPVEGGDQPGVPPTPPPSLLPDPCPKCEHPMLSGEMHHENGPSNRWICSKCNFAVKK